MTIEFSFGKCKTKATYSAKLRQPGKLNLEKIKKRFTTLLETPILLVISVQGIEIVVHGYGELLFKKCEDMDLMEKIAGQVYEVGMGRS